ncbi:MoaD/ThiS family protein [Neisseriaceae bacterium ESL0693]|nr:MoaD/ThiS family protein [Neisseriaceae bacterium ESL0693]
MITVMYLARIADEVGQAQEQLDSSFADTEALLSFLRQRGAPWDNALTEDKIYKIAVNNVILHTHAALKDGDTVAFLPPVTGG